MLSKEQIEIVRRLIIDTDAVISAYLDDASQPREALNYADLHAREARFCVDNYGNCSMEVLIEEADPSCLGFKKYVRDGLMKFGWNVYCVTEW